jgi:hypothetical protein
MLEYGRNWALNCLLQEVTTPYPNPIKQHSLCQSYFADVGFQGVWSYLWVNSMPDIQPASVNQVAKLHGKK